jgi:hypothetical protein
MTENASNGQKLLNLNKTKHRFLKSRSDVKNDSFPENKNCNWLWP